MSFDETKLDEELDSIDFSSEEGIEKIEEAKTLLPLHYENLTNTIGGAIGTDFNPERLTPNIQKMLKVFELEAPALGTQTNVMVASMAYANTFGKFRPYIRDVLVSKKTDIPTNIFTLNFQGSGDGKDKSFDLGTEILKEADTMVLDQMEVLAEEKAKRIAIKINNDKQLKNNVPKDKLVTDDTGWAQYIVKPNSGIIKMATYEGLLAEAEIIMKSSDLGNLFVAMSELGNSLKLDPSIDRLLMIMAELYDMGKAPEDLKKTKELKTGAIEGLAPSMLAHTSPNIILKDAKLAEKFIMIIESYFGRRAYIFFTEALETIQKIELDTDIDEQVRKMQSSTHKTVSDIRELETTATASVKRLLDGTDLERITLTDDAQALYGKYFLINKYYRKLAYMLNEDFQGSGLLVELTNRHWKAIKLAGIWALAENTSEITLEILSSAIYFTEYTGKGLRKLMSMVNLEVHERFVKGILDGDIKNSIRFDTLIKKAFIRKADKIQITNLLVAVNSALQGKAVVVADYKESLLTIDLIKEAEGKYGFSYIKFPKGTSKEDRRSKAYKGFKYYRNDLHMLKKLLTQDCAYSPFKFKGGYRKDDNIDSTTNYIVLDVDKSELDMELLHKTYLSGTLHIIGTTSDPENKFKFRVIIPVKQQIGDNNAVYKYVTQRIADELMLDIDLLGRSQVMFGYNGGSTLDNIDTGLQPMDISEFIKDAATKVPSRTYTTKLTKAQQTKAQADMEHDFETIFNFAIYAPVGNRNLSTWIAGRKMKQAGCDHRTITLLINKINSARNSPIASKDIRYIIGQMVD